MNQPLRDHTNNLRTALLALPPTGALGFEGLIAATLTGICGAPFRLASSGSQFGVDGKTTYEADGVCFEGKRYDGSVPRTEVLSKIAELSIADRGVTDLWVLGATTQVNTQLADDVERFGRTSGIATLILDWSTDGLAPLGVALAMSQMAASEFLESHINSHLARDAVAALQAIREADAFTSHASRIHSLLQEPTIGSGVARKANNEWLTEVFSSKRKASLGQPLSPGDMSTGGCAERDGLVNQLKPLLAGKPDGKTVAVLGEEGNGKSWLVAHSWLSLEDKPLMAVFTAEDFSEVPPLPDFTTILIDKLIEQTGGQRSESATSRWLRRVERWRKQGLLDVPRLIVVIDGLNQRPHVDWARIIEAIGAETTRIGGRLVVTTRTAYYTNRIKQRLYSPAVEVMVPEWTEVERDSILAARQVRREDLRDSVATSLRNPRLLAIALELLQSAQIAELEELSVSRLLFEHMRVHERDAPFPRPAHEFARKLRDHARDILVRIVARQRNDLDIFDGDLESVSDGRFFIPVEDDPTRYRLEEDGLTLALGFAILDEVRSALRNQRAPAEALAGMLEPIDALDLTAEVVLAALTVACLDETCSTEIVQAIVAAFADLQNPNRDEFVAFAALVRKRADSFMRAAHRLCLAGASQPNFDWLDDALHAAKVDGAAWLLMSEEIRAGLGYYSLSVEREVLARRESDADEKIETERTRRQHELDTKLRDLSAAERQVLNSLVKNDDGDLNTLARFTLTLMAGKPVAPFARALVYWTFANALNADHLPPYKEFTNLIRMNRADWFETRDEILKACNVFQAPDISRTGKWALANTLQATGHPDDAAKAHALVSELTVDWPKFEGWRLVENYCASDPCDPRSTKPGNIANTSAQYSTIDMAKIRMGVSNSEADLFFSMARPGVARFEPQIGMGKHWELIGNVLTRSGFALRQGVFELRNHNALLSRENADTVLRRANALGKAHGGLGERDRWIVTQYHLLLAFPLLRASEQIQALLSQDADDDILQDVMDTAKPLDEPTFERLLDKAIRDSDERSQFVVLAFGRSTDTPVSKNARRHLASLVHAEVERVRTQALGLIARIGDVKLIDVVAKGGWSAETIPERSDEGWYGSLVILEAAARGMISHTEALKRVAPRLYGRAARLSVDAARDVALLIDASIKNAAELITSRAVPDIELRQVNSENTEPARYVASERLSSSDDAFEQMKLLAETNEAFEERQKRVREAFDAFIAEVVKAKAHVILGGLQFQDFDSIVAADGTMAERWYTTFINLPKSRRAAVHNVGLLLAHSLARWSVDKAVHLFSVLLDAAPLVRVTFSRAGLTLDSIALWSAEDHPALNDLRFARLDRAGTDNDLGNEVLAALWSRKTALLLAYAESRSQTGHPASIGRALMVAGLSEHNEFNQALLARYKDTPGFIGRAREAAMYAYERNAWAEHWFRQMCEAQLPEDFWRYSVLLTKIVDGRFDLWRSNSRNVGEPCRVFWRSAENDVQRRIERWRDRREQKLFGEDAPSRVFLSESLSH